MVTSEKRQQNKKHSKARFQKANLAQKTKLEKFGYEKAGITVGELRKSLKLGQKYAEQEDWEKALPPLLAAWEAMPEDMSILTLIAQGLSRLGVREHAIAVLERALTIHEPNENICSIMLNLAVEMGMFDIGVKLGLQLISMNPQSSDHYVNLATAYTGANMLDESIDMLQGILPLFPDNSDLWNVLATQVRERDGVDAADVFFEEALRLNPNELKVINNYAISFGRRNQFDKALELSLKALEISPELPESHVGAAQIYFLKGEMAKAWDHYEYRLDTRRKMHQTQIYTHGLPNWDGEDLSEKTLFVASEQGIGDEVMFGNFLPFLYERAKKLVIGCEHRLVSLYRRRFPDAIVDFCMDEVKQGYRYRYFPNIQNAINAGTLKVDYAVPLASALRHDWNASDKIKCHPDGFLRADPERKSEFAAWFEEIGPKPKVGIAWRSGITTGARLGDYATIEELGPIMNLADKVDFINLQYGDCSAELKTVKEKFGVTIHQVEGLDLKQDIEANVAIMTNCDLMLSACSAPGMFAISAGVPTILMTLLPPWWCFGNEDHIPFVKDASFVQGNNGRTWPDIIADVRSQMIRKLDL